MLEEISIYKGLLYLSYHDMDAAIICFEMAKKYNDTETNRILIAETYFKVSRDKFESKALKRAKINIEKALYLFCENAEYKALHEKIVLAGKKYSRKWIKLSVIFVMSVVIIICTIVFIFYMMQKSAWDDAKQGNTYSSYQVYINKYPEGRYVKEAYNLQDDALWYEAKRNNSIQSYNNYISLFNNNGKHVADAISLKEKVRWKEIQIVNTIAVYNTYINEYPNGQYVSLAY